MDAFKLRANCYRHFEFIPSRTDGIMSWILKRNVLDIQEFDSFLHAKFGDYEKNGFSMETLIEKEYGKERSTFIRPFWPGADYKETQYPAGCVVVDNPPFSILTEIIRYYLENRIRFFLFAPALTLFSSRDVDVSFLAAGCPITYENGAEVTTSFVTDLDTCRARTCPELYKAVKKANDENLKDRKKELPKYEYPNEVVTAAIVQRWTHYGIDWRLEKDACVKVSALDSQKVKGKQIFGKGFLLSERAAAERAAAERAAAERAAEERAAAHKWELSEREKQIISRLR